MRKIFLPFAAAIALSVSGCATTELGVGASPAPLQQSVADEKALIYSYESYDALLTVVDKALDAGLIVPGTARALSIRNNLIRVKAALNAASAARRAGSVAEYDRAFTEAAEAMRLAKLAIKG